MNKLHKGALLIALSISLCGCGNSLSSKALDQGKLALTEKNYDKACLSFELAIQEDSKNKEAKELLEITKGYVEAASRFSAGDLEEAKNIYTSIPKEYEKYIIRASINELGDNIKKVEEAEIAEKARIEEAKKAEEQARAEEEARRIEEEKKAQEVKHQMTEEEARILLQSRAKFDSRYTVQLMGREGAQATILAYNFWVYMDGEVQTRTFGHYRVDAINKTVYDEVLNQFI